MANYRFCVNCWMVYNGASSERPKCEDAGHRILPLTQAIFACFMPERPGTLWATKMEETLKYLQMTYGDAKYRQDKDPYDPGNTGCMEDLVWERESVLPKDNKGNVHCVGALFNAFVHNLHRCKEHLSGVSVDASKLIRMKRGFFVQYAGHPEGCAGAVQTEGMGFWHKDLLRVEFGDVIQMEKGSWGHAVLAIGLAKAFDHGKVWDHCLICWGANVSTNLGGDYFPPRPGRIFNIGHLIVG